MFRIRLSYRDIEELMKIRNFKVNHSTIKSWIVKYSLIIEI